MSSFIYTNTQAPTHTKNTRKIPGSAVRDSTKCDFAKCDSAGCDLCDLYECDLAELLSSLLSCPTLICFDLLWFYISYFMFTANFISNCLSSLFSFLIISLFIIKESSTV